MESETVLCGDVPRKMISVPTNCTVAHGLMPIIPVEPRVSSDYESASSISSVESTLNNTTPPRRIFGITYDQFKKAVKIKRKFVTPKLCYFLFYSSRSLFVTYYILFLTSTGLDPKQAGIIHGVRMVFITLGAIFWGYLADKSKKDVVILTIKFISFSVIVFSKPWVAHWITVQETPKEHREHIKEAVVKTLETLNNTHELHIIMEKSDKDIVDMFGFTWPVMHYKTADVPLYITMLGLGIASAFAGGALHILIDSKVQTMAKNCSTSSNAYGRQRLWGSFAYSVTPIFAGLVLEASPVSRISEYMPVFYMHLVFMALALISCIILYNQKPKQKTPVVVELQEDPLNKKDYEGIGSVLRRLMKNPHMIFFTLHVLIMGIGNGLQWSFQFLLMEEMGASKTLMGFCSFTQCFTESLLYPIASKLTKIIGGPLVARPISIFAYSILFTVYAFCNNPVYFTIAVCGIGIGFTLFFTASMDELYYIGNPRCMMSLYALYNAILIGVGSSLAGSIGGLVYKNYGGKALYFGGMIIYSIIGLISIVYAILDKKSILPRWDRSNVYTKFSNKASYSAKCDQSRKISTVANDESNSDEAIHMTMEAETVL